MNEQFRDDRPHPGLDEIEGMSIDQQPPHIFNGENPDETPATEGVPAPQEEDWLSQQFGMFYD